MVKHTQKQFECVWPFCGFGVKGLRVMSCQSATYFARSFFTRTFVYTLGSAIFRNTSERLLCIFFSLTGMCQAGIYLFVSLFLQKIRRPVLVSDKLELGVCRIILDVSLNFPQFSDHRSSFREVFRKSVTR